MGSGEKVKKKHIQEFVIVLPRVYSFLKHTSDAFSGLRGRRAFLPGPAPCSCQ